MAPSRAPGGLVLGRIGGAPVVVNPTSAFLGLIIAGSWFPAVSSALGAYGIVTVMGVIVATVAGVAVSVLAHELAHGLTGTILGRRPVAYELHLLGGRTTFGSATGWRPWKDVLTSLAGPATNLALWALLGQIQDVLVPPVAPGVVLWALTWVNLALAIFNALPGLPLDGGHALAALIEQVTGRARLGQQVAAWGGLGVVALVLWHYVIGPLLLDGARPSTFSLMLVILVAWSIGATCVNVLGLGGGSRAAARLDLHDLARPVATCSAGTRLEEVRTMLAEAAVVLVVDGPDLLGLVDADGLQTLNDLDPRTATAAAVCTALPAQALTASASGQAAVDALKAARAVSRWLLLVEGGRVTGAVPTGAR